NKSNKKFYANNIYLNEIFIEKNEYADAGELLYELYDFSKLKLIIFVKADEIKQLREKKLFVDNIQNDFNIEKISQVRDTKRVSTYKVVLSKVNLNKNNIYFGQVVKVEFR
ncbi:MAG: HlyD family efflux transporter periplasmic adaptor subunit, partial [Campylobacteraceae bacterium]|nr:HlyD family efflux transporter periplasmic adaptor subunit [Campylobacteraceae bacterium]